MDGGKQRWTDDTGIAVKETKKYFVFSKLKLN